LNKLNAAPDRDGRPAARLSGESPASVCAASQRRHLALRAALASLILILILSILCGVPGEVASAQTNDEAGADDLAGAIQQFAEENLDPDVLQVLQGVGQQQVEDFFSHYREYLRGDYVLDVAQLKDAANAILPLLDAHEETQPYAAWLRTQLDYLDAADELKSATPQPKPEPGKPRKRPPNPSYRIEHEMWIRRVNARPWPKGAAGVVPQMKAVFAAEHVPLELVWLAEVESGFDTRALSPAGASGPFQLMPATAKRYGLSLWPWDERRQVQPSAAAAAKCLRALYAQFRDWRLAVAAYNCGGAQVQKLLDRSDARDYESIATRLPAETQMYVPRVEATILHREGVELEKLKAPGPIGK
jgi:membrane-bound lytic murein transglycosylase D